MSVMVGSFGGNVVFPFTLSVSVIGQLLVTFTLIIFIQLFPKFHVIR